MLERIRFHAQKPAEPSSPNRVDVACFVGFVAYRGGPLPLAQSQWLQSRGWLAPLATGRSPFHRDDALSLLDVPVPIDSWDAFDELFAWEARPVRASDARATTYLGAAVRSFFAQGGRRCYVIRVGDPPAANESRSPAARLSLLGRMLPGYPARLAASRSDRETWRGVGHLFGLPDASFLCLPDLPDLLQSRAAAVPAELPEPPQLPERFVECSEPQPPPPPDDAVARLPAPRLDPADYAEWSTAIRRAGQFLASQRREVQLLAAVPLPAEGSEAAADIYRFLHDEGYLRHGLADGSDPRGIGSAFVQLAYPWLRTRGTANLPERIEPPDGVLAGLLARNAVLNGTFRSATDATQRDVIATVPELSDRARMQPLGGTGRLAALAFVDRVSTFAPGIDGIELQSDVTTSLTADFRAAGIRRLVALVARAARSLGEDLAFENSGEHLWNRLRLRMDDLLLTLFSVGALRGETPQEAYEVRCDRTTMTQNDIDSGRVIARIALAPSAPIERIDVTLTLDPADQVSLASIGIEEAAA